MHEVYECELFHYNYKVREYQRIKPICEEKPVRVIAGSARRVLLDTPKGESTRPTSDRVKENLFNIISPYITDARFLDLFCGSGAVGIEALSRGASEAVFVDSSVDAVKVTRANLTQTRLSGEVHKMCVLSAMSVLSKEGRVFDIVFMDPPYSNGLLDVVLANVVDHGLLSKNALIIAECAKGEQIESNALVLQDTRVYGSTQLLFYVKK